MQQQEFDFDDIPGQQRRTNIRGTRRRNIERLEIPAQPEGTPKRVSPTTCKAVLLLVDEHVRENEGWRLKASTIADKLGYRDRQTVSRALRHLQELGLIEINRTGRASLIQVNHGIISTAVEQQEAAAHSGGRPPVEAAPQREERPHQMRAQPSSDEGATLIRRGRNPHQMRAQPSSTIEPLKNNPTTTKAHADAKPPGGGWRRIFEFLGGVGLWPATLRELEAQLPERLDVESVEAIVDHWREHGGGTPAAAWRVGALVGRLRAARPGEDPTAGWPPALPDHRREQQASQRAEAKREKAAKSEQQAAEDAAAQQRADRLEAAHGPTLDAMAEADLRQLVGEVLPDFLAQRFLRDRSSPTVRLKLLEALDSRASPALSSSHRRGSTREGPQVDAQDAPRPQREPRANETPQGRKWPPGGV